MRTIDFKSDCGRGWLVARNPLRALNHLDQLKKYNSIAESLYLSPSCNDKNLAANNIKILEKHQGNKIDFQEAIHLIYTNIKAKKKISSTKEIKQLLKTIFPVAHMEFHPTDLCNLSCSGCTYGHDRSTKKGKDVFPFNGLEKLSALNPQSIVIVGGGEPTLYKDKNHTFTDLTRSLRNILPKAKFGLITNGTFFPNSADFSCFDWLRVSIDASTPNMYKTFRGKDFFNNVCQNLLLFLTTPVEYVGIGFLYSKINIGEYVECIRFFYGLVKSRTPQYLKKFNIQFRPLRQDPKDEGNHFPEAISKNEIDSVFKKIYQLANTGKDIEDFIKNQTNAEIVEKGNTHHPLDFNMCYYSLIFNILRANGDIYPCFITVDQDEFCLGNLLTDPPEKISLNKLLIAGKQREICNPFQCRQCHINHILDGGLKGNRLPSDSPEVKRNPFF